jgi:hypothetical protein
MPWQTAARAAAGLVLAARRRNLRYHLPFPCVGITSSF